MGADVLSFVPMRYFFKTTIPKIILPLLVATYALGAHASDFFLIEKPLSSDIKKIANLQQLPENKKEYATPLGVLSHCYIGKAYLVLSKNEFGNGYEMTMTKPDKAVCTPLSAQFGQVNNSSGMHLGMKKSEVTKLLDIPQPSDKATLLYNQKTSLDGTTYDEQTWVDVEFNEDKLVRLSVFVSLTK